jgi:putative phage-type endonuclease
MTTTEAPPILVPGSIDWHAYRAQGIGASEIAALFSLSPYGGPMDVYLAKTTPPDELAARSATREQRRGSKLEAYIADEAAERFGWRLVTVGPQAHPVHSFLRASPDRLLLDEAGNIAALIEIKTARTREGWADPKEDPTGVPMHYALQVAQQMLVGVDWKGEHVFPRSAFVVASVGSLDDISLYGLSADPAVEARIIEVGGAFWRDHVVARVPPPFDGSEGGNALLKLMYPADARPELLRASVEDAKDASELRAARENLATAEKAEAELVQRIKARIGDAAGLQGDGFRFTWKSAKPTEKTDWQATAAELQRRLAAEVGEPEASAVVRKILAANTKTTPGARRFLATFA